MATVVSIGVLVTAACALLVGLLAAGLGLSPALAARRARLRATLARPGALVALTLVQGLFWSAFFGALHVLAGRFEDDNLAHAIAGYVIYVSAVIAGSVLQLLVLAALLIELRRLYAALGERRASAPAVGALLTVGFLAVFVLLVVFRDSLAPALSSTGTTHLTAHEFTGLDLRPGDRARHTAWLAEWDSGRIVAGEAVFLVALAWAHALIGRFLGRRRVLGPAAGIAATLALCLAACLALGLVAITYDVFHDGTVAGPLAFELLLPFLVQMPETLLVTPFVLVFALVVRWSLRPERSGAAAPASAPA